jgi:3-methyl-2-oxobutanoate hydroxymethyltransferase
MKKQIKSVFNKKNKKKIICLTSYSYNFTKIIDGLVDVILVGDSMGMVLYGMDNTREITDEIMIRHASAVKKASKNSLVFFDLPYSKNFSEENIIKRSKKIFNKTKCDGVKIEGNSELADVIKYLKKIKIPVMAHVGLQPQKFSSSRKFKIFGRKEEDLENILNDCMILEKAGAVSLLLEGMLTKIAKQITLSSKIPTIGIGASEYCDGQILVSEDMLGMFTEYHPKFVKKYAKLSSNIQNAIRNYSKEVNSLKFPNKKFRYD